MFKEEIATITIVETDLTPHIKSLVRYKNTDSYVYILTYEQLDIVKHSDSFTTVKVNIVKDNEILASNKDLPNRLFNYITEKIIFNGDIIITYKNNDGLVRNTDNKIVFNRR
jgi:hypothetical protein